MNQNVGNCQRLNFFLGIEQMYADSDTLFSANANKEIKNMNPTLQAVKQNIGDIRSTFITVNQCLDGYDKKLVEVLAQHENDFIYAYKTHMYKIERELKTLKQKSKEQDAKLTQDVRIISLQESLKKYQGEFQLLMTQKEKNDEQIRHLKD